MAAAGMERQVALLLLLVCCCATLVPSWGAAQGGPGWIVSGPGHTPDGLPVCSFCVNVLNAVFYRNWTDLSVGIYRCLKTDANELWTVDTVTNNSISIMDYSNNTLCLDAGNRQPDYVGHNITLLPLLLMPCDGSASQRWFWEGGMVRSNLSGVDGSALYLAQGQVTGLPNATTTDMSAYYNLYLSTEAALNTTPGFLTADFVFQPLSNYQSSPTPGLLLQAGSPAQPGNLIRNGGFENTTIFTGWPAGQNCSSFTKSCSRMQYFAGELFSLCSWSILSAPQLVYDRAPTWKAAEGLSSLLLSNRGTLNQTFPTQPGTTYVVSFALAGYLQHSPTQDAFLLCTNVTATFLTVQVDTSPPWMFDLQPSELSIQGSDTAWVTKNVTFTASSTATIVAFSGAGAAVCGLVLDDVHVTASAQGGGQGDGAAAPTLQPAGGSKSKVGIAVGAGLGGGVALLLLLLGLALWWRRGRNKRNLVSHAGDQSAQHVKVFSYATLEKATSNWTTLIGEGGFSMVYRAQFQDGTVGAVKVEKSRRSKSSVFKKELEVLLRMSHKNLVNLIGFCAEKAHPILVFEFLPKGNLCERLHSDQADVLPLQWHARMKIAYQVAAALRYLHHGTSPPIGHRDVKSANVLLTSSDSAKLADFGLSKSAPADASAFMTVQTDVKGSLGYLDPRYVRSGVYSLKSDVYSYGVVVLELLTGHPAIKDGDLLPFWAAKYINDPAIAQEMLDARLDGEHNKSDLTILVDLVKMCLQDEAQQRPTMQQVVSFLVDSQFSGCPPVSSVPVPDSISKFSMDDSSSSGHAFSFSPSGTSPAQGNQSV